MRCLESEKWSDRHMGDESNEECIESVSTPCMCAYVRASVPSSYIMTCSETTLSPSRLPLRAHNRHAGSLCARWRTQSYKHSNCRVMPRQEAGRLDAPKWLIFLAQPPLICFLRARMGLIKRIKEGEIILSPRFVYFKPETP